MFLNLLVLLTKTLLECLNSINCSVSSHHNKKPIDAYSLMLYAIIHKPPNCRHEKCQKIPAKNTGNKYWHFLNFLPPELQVYNLECRLEKHLPRPNKHECQILDVVVATLQMAKCIETGLPTKSPHIVIPATFLTKTKPLCITKNKKISSYVD